jgi:hypothetical protein
VSDWQRLALGPRGRWLGKDRWAYAGVIAMVGAAVSAWGGMWLEAALFFAVALVLAVISVRQWTSGGGDVVAKSDDR